MVAYRLLSSAMHNNDDNDWPVHSLMLSYRDLRGLALLSTVPQYDFKQRIVTADMAEPQVPHVRLGY